MCRCVDHTAVDARMQPDRTAQANLVRPDFRRACDQIARALKSITIADDYP